MSLAESERCDDAAFTELLSHADLATILCHGFVDSEDRDVGFVLATEGRLPLSSSSAAASPAGRRHRFGYHAAAWVDTAPKVLLSAACSTGLSQHLSFGEHGGLYAALRSKGLRTVVAPHWDAVAADILPILSQVRASYLDGVDLAHAVRDASLSAIGRGVPAWSALALTINGDWR